MNIGNIHYIYQTFGMKGLSKIEYINKPKHFRILICTDFTDQHLMHLYKIKKTIIGPANSNIYTYVDVYKVMNEETYILVDKYDHVNCQIYIGIDKIHTIIKQKYL